MSTLDNLTQDVVGAVGGGAEHAGTVQALLKMFGGQGAQGLGGLAQAFENQGLGQLMASWVGKGPNPAVSPAQVEQVLGSGKLAQVAQEAGITPEMAKSTVAAVLPTLIDRLTPGGAMPEHSLLGDALGLLKNRL